MRGKNFLAGNRRSRSLKSPSFGNIVFTFSPDLDIFRNSLQKKTFTQSLGGGGHGPPGPPPGYATARDNRLR